MGVVSDEMSYYVNAERDHDERETSLNGSISSNLHYTQVSLAAGASGSDSRTYNGTMSGGIAVHDQGVTFSPWTINDTFAIAKWITILQVSELHLRQAQYGQISG